MVAIYLNNRTIVINDGTARSTTFDSGYFSFRSNPTDGTVTILNSSKPSFSYTANAINVSDRSNRLVGTYTDVVNYLNEITSSASSSSTGRHSGLLLDDGSNPHGTTKSDVGLGNVDNTSDLDKPISTATQAELDAKEDDLGTPAADGYVLSSTTGDVRSWIDPNSKGIEAFFIQANGSFGTGGGWADSGFIGDVPLLFFNQNSSEKAIYSFYITGRSILTDIDPQMVFVVYSTGAPVATTGDDVVWQLEVRYIAETELATKTPDETLIITQTLTTLTANTRQELLIFTFDRTLITNQDDIQMTLTRLGSDAADTYSSDIGVGQSGIAIETSNHNS